MKPPNVTLRLSLKENVRAGMGDEAGEGGAEGRNTVAVTQETLHLFYSEGTAGGGKGQGGR